MKTKLYRAFAALLAGLFGGILSVIALSSGLIGMSAFALCVVVLLLILAEELLVFTYKIDPFYGLIFHIGAALCTFGLAFYLFKFGAPSYTTLTIHPWEWCVLAFILFLRIFLHPIYKIMYTNKP